MALQLNDPTDIYKDFSGRYSEQMPQLISEGRIPMSVADIMRRRLDVAQGSPELRAAWLFNYFDTSDAIFYHPNGNFKIMRDAAALRRISTQSITRFGALQIDDEHYRAAAGPEFSRNDLVVETPLTKGQACTHPVWHALAGGDSSLLREYTDLAFHVHDLANYLGVSLRAPPATPSVRPWTVHGINRGVSLEGSGYLANIEGRLVGRAPYVGW